MVVMVLEKVSAKLRGELSRWLMEPHTGVFIGHVSAMVREQLWQMCIKEAKSGGVVQAWNSNNEQRFLMRMAGDTQRCLVEMEGLQLVQELHKTKEVKTPV